MVKAIDLIGSNNQLQGHWARRFVAYIIDAIILGIILTVIIWVLDLPDFIRNDYLLVQSSIHGLIFFIYCTILEYSSGTTLGKQLMNLKVVPTVGSRDITKELLRNITKIHWLVFLVDWLMGFITEGDPRQRLFDRIANTSVVRTDVQEIFQGAYQPPAGPMPAPYSPQGQQPQYGAPPQRAPQQRPSPYPQGQQRAAPQRPPAQQQAAPQPRGPAQSPAQEAGPVEPVPEEGPTVYTRQELVEKRKDDLIKIARLKGMKVSGTKRDLIDRILGEEV